MWVISNRRTEFPEKNAWHDISFGSDHVHRLMKKTLLKKFVHTREWLWMVRLAQLQTMPSMRRIRLKQLVSILVLWLGWSTALAQFDSLVQQADRLLSYKAYGRAIEAYTQLLTEPTSKLTPVQKGTVQSQLAYAYRQVGSGAKAEQLYRESMDSGLDEPQQTLNFAQTLASNGKFQESQQQYELYLQQKDKVVAQRLPTGPVVATGPAGGQRESGRYRLEYLAINTPGEEFSPAFYRDGLIYVSGSKGGSAIGVLGRGGSSSVLDLFYVPNRDGLKATIISANGTNKKAGDNRTRGGGQAGADERSRSTANDSPMLSGLNRSSANAPQRLSDALNSRYHEGPVTFSRDGSRIIFTRNNYPEGRARQSAGGTTKLSLHTARRENGVWVDVVGLPFNNDDYSVGHPTLSRDEQLLYFVSDMPGGFGGTDLYVSRYQNGSWGRPVNLGEDINTTGSELFPFVDDAGNLYFSTNGRKGLGELDIFFATVTTLSTGFVVQSVDHLNAPVNSPGDDFGLITNNRLGGYFSSNRRDGNDDIYRFTREETPGAYRDLTIQLYDGSSNSPLDSTRIVVKAKEGGRPDKVMTTDRNGFARLCLDRNNDFTFEASRDGYTASMVGFTTRSLTDNQSTRIQMSLTKLTNRADTVLAGPAAVVESAAVTRSRLRGVVTGDRDGRPIEGVTVRLRNECNGNRLRYVTKRDGRYDFDIVADCNYTLIASKPTFGTNEKKIKRLPKRAKSNVLSADLRMLGVGDVMLIDNIYHDLDRSSLRPDAARELEKLVATMRKYPSLIVEIRSHTDSRGSADVNRTLSAQRARSIADYLATKGIGRRRMTTIGMGESRLLNNCTDDVICTEAEHQRNRRTEFRVVDIK